MDSYELKDLPEETKMRQVNGVWIKASEYKDPIDLLDTRIKLLEAKK